MPTPPESGKELEKYALARCGGTNWMSTNVSTSEFEYLARKFLAECNVAIDEKALLGSPADGTQAKAAHEKFVSELSACPKKP